MAAVRAGTVTLPDAGRIVLLDPIGGPIAVALAEELGERAVLVTQDNIAGNELSRTGDLAPANVRLQQRGAVIERRNDRPYCPSRGGERLVRGGCCARGRGPRSRSRTASAASGG